ncbi:MAG TPA: plasmid mobilization relaxosome protein MobC [Thermoanaerobaculia bacterium]|nr:plasmid mobilization relaxosome protein MobC [Thermoanaerobaculia bacterium]
MPRHPTRHRPGRPALPAEWRRDHPLMLRLTSSEHDVLRRRAALARLPTAVYVREAALRRRSPPRVVPLVNIRMVGQLGRLGNNLNQLTKLAHQGQTSPALLPCLSELLVELRRLRRLLIGLPAIDDDLSVAS